MILSKDMDIQQLINEVNLELSKDKNLSVNKLAVKWGVNQSSLKSKLRQGYRYDTDNRRYVPKGGEATSMAIEEEVKSPEDVTSSGNIIIDKELKDKLDIILEHHDKLMFLIDNYDKIMTVLEWYDKRYDKQYNRKFEDMEIKLPVEIVKDFKTTVRINDVVWEDFKSFSSKYDSSKKDLLSQALLNYMNQYGAYDSMYDIKIELPKEVTKDYRTSMRVNHIVWEKFQEFCSNIDGFTQKELLSQALYSFM